MSISVPFSQSGYLQTLYIKIERDAYYLMLQHQHLSLIIEAIQSLIKITFTVRLLETVNGACFIS